MRHKGATIFKDFQQAQEYLESFIFPKDNYQYLKLERITHLLSLLKNPHQKFPSIHIGGTAGKGSTSFITAAILQEAGYKVGLHMSPHLQVVNERLLINSIPISDEQFVSYVGRIQPYIERVNKEGKFGYPSYFEILVALTFWYFAEQRVDIAVIEVGLGGTLDATNVIIPEVAVITNVGLDHTDWLGDTLEEIATKKIGIIKNNCVAITGLTQENTLKIFDNKCNKLGSKSLVLGRDFDISETMSSKDANIFSYKIGNEEINDITLSLKGSFQIFNAALAITAVRNCKSVTVPVNMIRRALKNLNFPGRFEKVLFEGKIFIIDGAHNPMKIEAFVSGVQKIYPNQKFPIIFAVKKNKNYQTMLQTLDTIASEYIITSFENNKKGGRKLATGVEEIMEFVNKEKKITVTQNTRESLVYVSLQKEFENIIVTGSLYLAGEVRTLLHLSWNEYYPNPEKTITPEIASHL